MSRLPSTLTTKSESDHIISYLVNENQRTKISKKLEEKLERYEYCRDLLKQYGSRTKVVPIMRKKYNLSRSQAVSDIEETQYIFGATSKHNREFWVDILIGEIMKTKTFAISKRDARAAATADKNMIYVIEKFMGDDGVPAFENLQPVNVLLGFFPEQVNSQKLSDEEIEQAYKRLSKTKKKIELFADAQDV